MEMKGSEPNGAKDIQVWKGRVVIKRGRFLSPGSMQKIWDPSRDFMPSGTKATFPSFQRFVSHQMQAVIMKSLKSLCHQRQPQQHCHYKKFNCKNCLLGVLREFLDMKVQEHPLGKFLLTLADEVKQLSLHLQLKVKHKVLQVYLKDLFMKEEFALNLDNSILKEVAAINRCDYLYIFK